VIIGTIGSRAVLRGTVLTVEDGDALVEVVGRVAGIDEVVDETELAD
jgi:osmotically-inducible protein OsmY